MNFRNARTYGVFEAKPVGDGEREYVNDVIYEFEYRLKRGLAWRKGSVTVRKGYRFNGTSRPGIVGWLVPRYGELSEASGLHDFIFDRRPEIAPGVRLNRKDSDELFLEFMRLVISRRNPGFVTEHREKLAVLIYVSVRQFGAMVWNKHDDEFRRDTSWKKTL